MVVPLLRAMLGSAAPTRNNQSAASERGHAAFPQTVKEPSQSKQGAEHVTKEQSDIRTLLHGGCALSPSPSWYDSREAKMGQQGPLGLFLSTAPYVVPSTFRMHL